MFEQLKSKFIKWVLQKAFAFLIEAYEEFGETKINQYIDEAIAGVDEVLEKKLGKEKATKIEKEMLDAGEKYIQAMKKEMND